MAQKRGLEVLWSLFLVGELGSGRVAKGVLRGMMALVGVVLLVGLVSMAGVWLLAENPWLGQRVGQLLLSVIFLVGMVGVIWRIIRR